MHGHARMPGILNIVRAPQNGRTFEGYGEGTFLTSPIAAAVIRGIQSQHVMAEANQFAANDNDAISSFEPSTPVAPDSGTARWKAGSAHGGAGHGAAEK